MTISGGGGVSVYCITIFMHRVNVTQTTDTKSEFGLTKAQKRSDISGD